MKGPGPRLPRVRFKRMHSFFTEPPRGGLVRLSQEDAHHILKSLRMQPGDHVSVAFDGSRHEAALEMSEKGVYARLLQELPSGEPRVRVTLYQGLPKGDRMDFIVQKCTELGVHRIVPCLFSRGVARWEGGQNKLTRWRRIAREAAVQCGRSLVPEVSDCISFEALCRALPEHEQALVPWEEGGLPLRQANPQGQDVALVIGPEGGISPEEVQALQAQPVTLGPRILRTETAGMAALTMLLALSGDME